MSRLSALPVRTARWSATHPWRAIGAWFVFVALAVGLALAIPTTSTRSSDYWVGESGRASQLVEESGLSQPRTESILITPRTGEVLDEATVAGVAADVRRSLTGVTGVADVGRVVWNGDRSAALVPVRLTRDADDAAPIRSAVEDVRAAAPRLQVAAAGDLTVNAGINARVVEDLHSAELLSIPVTIVLMLLAFGALIAAGVPVLLAGTSVAATMGLAAPISHLVHAEPSVNSVIVLIGMAVGVDYSLFYLKREREERAKGRTTPDAVAIAAETSGHAILVSGGAVVAAMAGLYLVGRVTFASLATGAIVVVAVAVIGSLTVLPALLVTLGRWVDRPRIPVVWHLTSRIPRGAISGRILRPVLRRPALSLAIGLAVTGALAAPALGMTMRSASLATLPADIPVVQTLHRISEEFPGQGSTVAVVVKGAASTQPELTRALTAVQDAAAAGRSFVPVGPGAIAVSSDRTVSVLRMGVPWDDGDPRVSTAVASLRSDLAPRAFAGLDAEVVIGGGPAESIDSADRQSARMPYVIGFVLLLTFAMMLVSFRSLPIALASTALNLLSVGVAFGVLRWVFQDGHLASALDFTSPGYLIDWIPLFVMTILVGLSMDYHVFVLSRVREYVASGIPARQAVRRGIADTAGVITSAAAVMVSVFSIFATLSMLEMKMMGVGLAAAILLDATVIRLVMLPAILVLLGDRAWHHPSGAGPRAPAPAGSVDGAPQLAGTPR